MSRLKALFSPLFKRLRTATSGWLRTGSLAVTASALVVGVGYGTLHYAVPYAAGHSYFSLRSVRVSCDRPAVAPERLASLSGLHQGVSLWDVDFDDIRRRLGELPWVDHVHIARRFPGEVYLRVTQRTPVAAASGPDGAYLIDAEGAVFLAPQEGAYPDLPYLNGWLGFDDKIEAAKRLRIEMAILGAATAAGVPVSEIDVDDDGVFWLFPEAPRLAIRLGRDPRPTRAMAWYDSVIDDLGLLADAAEEIDLSFEDRVVVRGGDGALAPLLMAREGFQRGLAGAAGEAGRG